MSLSEGFHTTRWTLVRHAAEPGSDGRKALSDLCAAYYEPVVAFLRREMRDEESAREMAHEFFAGVLARPTLGGAEPGRGRFRSYLLGALKHHLSHQREFASRLKRGGGAETIALLPPSDTSPGIEPGDSQTLSPDREFDRQWALHVLQKATAALAEEWRAAGREQEFANLHPFIAGESAHGGLAALAERLGENPATLRKTVSRMRQQFRHHVKAELAPTLSDSREADDEMRILLAALAP